MKQLVQSGYDKMAKIYTKHRSELRTGRYLREFTRMMIKGGKVLDLGCGTGLEVDDYLVKKGFWVTGLDISPEMIKLARKNFPTVDYQIGDLESLKLSEYRADGLVCLYTMFHLPRAKHQQLLNIFASFLATGAPMLITMGDREFEGEHAMYGIRMWASQWGREKNLTLIKKAGFGIIKEEIDNSGGERHQIILARKKGK